MRRASRFNYPRFFPMSCLIRLISCRAISGVNIDRSLHTQSRSQQRTSECVSSAGAHIHVLHNGGGGIKPHTNNNGVPWMCLRNEQFACTSPPPLPRRAPEFFALCQSAKLSVVAPQGGQTCRANLIDLSIFQAWIGLRKLTPGWEER